jgi:hypothetical protein
MAMPVLTANDVAQCTHGIKATLMPTTGKVLIEGGIAIVDGDQAVVAGCPFTVPPSKPQPCVKIKLSMTASKVKVQNRSVQLYNPADMCETAEQATNGPAVFTKTQAKVIAT